jgi:hypothetical protein
MGILTTPRTRSYADNTGMYSHIAFAKAMTP